MNNNPLLKDLTVYVDVSDALAFLYFARKSKTREILHELKYKSNRKVGTYLGAQFGRTLRDSAWDHTAYDGLVPVPISVKKRRIRGYNQSEAIAEGMAVELELPVLTNILKRTHSGKSQTVKGRVDRFESIRHNFELIEGNIDEGTSLLLVDDVYTTGATSQHCLGLMKTGGAERVGFASLAYRSGM